VGSGLGCGSLSSRMRRGRMWMGDEKDGIYIGAVILISCMLLL
jgi:hypothetical protein